MRFIVGDLVLKPGAMTELKSFRLKNWRYFVPITSHLKMRNMKSFYIWVYDILLNVGC